MTASLYTSVPAYCPTCKRLFSNSALALGAGAVLTLSNCSTNCPKGHEAHFLDGSYSLQNSVLELATTSPETLRILQKLAEQVIEGELGQQDAAEKILELAPSLAPIFNRKSSDLLPWFALLVYLIVELAKAGLGNSPTSQSPPVIFNQIIKQQSSERATPSPSETETWALDRGRSKRQKRRDRGRGFYGKSSSSNA
jgi:hypothetical protein